MWLEPKNAACLKGGKKNGFLVSANPTDHPTHQTNLRSRMRVAEELAKATDAGAALAAYKRVLSNKQPPNEGVVLTMNGL